MCTLVALFALNERSHRVGSRDSYKTIHTNGINRAIFIHAMRKNAARFHWLSGDKKEDRGCYNPG